jgi:predicted N-acyltransferase
VAEPYAITIVEAAKQCFNTTSLDLGNLVLADDHIRDALAAAAADRMCVLQAKHNRQVPMYRLSTHDSIEAIPQQDWNRLTDPDTPFLRHEFLSAMERHGCVGEGFGWLPHHLALRGAEGDLVAAAPCYLKLNSYGEFVFDWSWASAYQRIGLPYYPKLVVASPYTPATGPRILAAAGPRKNERVATLIRAALDVAEELGVSSMHWLFTSDAETQALQQQGLMHRVGCQFHWENRGYEDFDDFLSTFSSAKRKQVRRERRRVVEAGIRFRLLSGHEITNVEWETFHQLYCDTFDKRGGIPTLSLGFFRDIGHTLPDHCVLVLAYHREDIVAAAFDLVGTRSLYGRHWGCFSDFHSLHFETCYYQGLEHCIQRGLSRFEPGAQGEHKIRRGFLPTPTQSAHWIADSRLGEAIGQFLERERGGMQTYMTEMGKHSPYKSC